MYEVNVAGDGERFIWLERRAVNQLYRLRQRGEELSNVIVRVAAMEAQWSGRRPGAVAALAVAVASTARTGDRIL